MRRQVPSEVKNGRVLVVGGQVCLFAGSVLFRSKFFAFDHFNSAVDEPASVVLSGLCASHELHVAPPAANTNTSAAALAADLSLACGIWENRGFEI
mgnify:CR=1 FL=1